MTELHTLRFKRDGVELELTGSQADIQKAWGALESSVVGAFAEGAETRRRFPRQPHEQASESSNGASRSRRHGTRRSSSASKGTDGRQEVLTKLLSADFDGFPELPSDAKAVYTGLATLKWAKDELGIDGLTVSEIHRFLSEKLRYSQTADAYRFAFKQLPRATNATGSPKMYRLMRPGDEALAAYLKTVAAGGSETDAEKAGAEAEQKG